MEKRKEEIVSYYDSAAKKKKLGMSGEEVGQLEAMVMEGDEKLTCTAKGKEIIAADAENETLNKASKLDEINPSGDSKACIFCHKETDHGKDVCPLRDVSKKLCYPNALRISYTTIPVVPFSKENAKENTILVTKLSEDTCEADLEKLFGTFGDLRFVSLHKTRKSGKCYALVSFADIDDAERAKNKLNKDGYGIMWYCSPLP